MQSAPFFVSKLSVKTLPCVILFRSGHFLCCNYYVSISITKSRNITRKYYWAVLLVLFKLKILFSLILFIISYCLHSYFVRFFFRKGIAVDRLVGFQDLGGKDDFPTRMLENILIKKGNPSPPNHQKVYYAVIKSCQSLNHCHTGIINEKNVDEDGEDDECNENQHRSVRSSTNVDSDSDWI